MINVGAFLEKRYFMRVIDLIMWIWRCRLNHSRFCDNHLYRKLWPPSFDITVSLSARYCRSPMTRRSLSSLFLNSYQYIHISTFVWTALCIIFSYLATKISAPNTLFAVIECAKYSQVGGGSSNIKASVVKWVNHNLELDLESIWGTQ